MKIMINYQIRACCPQYTSLQLWLFILLSTTYIYQCLSCCFLEL